MKFYKNSILFLILVIFIDAQLASAQFGYEPTIEESIIVRSPLDDDLRNAISFGITLNNFGFGAGSEYRRVLSPRSEFVLDFQITALRDITEQNYQFFGQQIIPNKRNRIISFPLTAGFKYRLFAETVSDNFRFFVTGMGGPTASYVYPYYQLREVYFMLEQDIPAFQQGDLSVIQLGFLEANTGQISNDIFQGWGQGEWKFGAAGQVGIGVDFGSTFKNVSSVKVGFTFQYFDEGIQVMDPYRVLGYFQGTDQYPETIVAGPGTKTQKFFGSPYITLVFGRMW